MNFVFRRKKTNDYLSTTANFAFGCKKSKKKKKKKEVKNKKKRMGVWVQKLNTMKILQWPSKSENVNFLSSKHKVN